MKPKTQELLYLLLWAGDMLARPTFRNLTESFESWAYQTGFHRQLSALEKQQLLESEKTPGGDRLYRLTEAGRRLALGPRDPAQRWKRRWDGKWRMVLFDVPQHRSSDRVRLRRSLANCGFGYLQNSVWITPDPLSTELESLRTGPVDVESLILLEARPCAGESDTEIVAGAWDFDTINLHYKRHLDVLERLPSDSIAGEAQARQWQRWLRDERVAWNEAVDRDPLLPERLLPSGYLGVKAWKRRLATMTKAGRQVRRFRAAR
jgi:phenylacetic acid degradation operon negative regulatory protein